MSINVTVTGTDEVRARFKALWPTVHSRVLATMQRVTIELQNHIRDDKLSGQVLKNRTGTLRRSINQRVEDGGTSVTGIVGANMDTARYAAAHEYGFHGRVTVRAHTRMITQVFGHRVAPHPIEVSAHSMNMNLPERSFLRSSLHEYEGRITESLTAAVSEAVNG